MNPLCPCCLGPGEYLGALGEFFWYRCLMCGMEFYKMELDYIRVDERED
jgi:hypothetical protein